MTVSKWWSELQGEKVGRKDCSDDCSGLCFGTSLEHPCLRCSVGFGVGLIVKQRNTTAWKMQSRPCPGWDLVCSPAAVERGRPSSYLQQYICDPVLLSALGSPWLHTAKSGLGNHGLGHLEIYFFHQAQVALPLSFLQVMVVQVPVGLRCEMECRAKP